MTLEEFSATGRDVEDLGAECKGMDLEGVSGRVYLYEGGPYIEKWEDDRFGIAPPNGPTWLLTLFNEQWDGPLEELEPRLFEWCQDEGLIKKEKAMRQIHGWKARRSGASMTVTGFEGDTEVRITDVEEIAIDAEGRTIATGPTLRDTDRNVVGEVRQIELVAHRPTA